MDRSAIMRAIRSKNTSPEIAVRKLLSAYGYRYRLHYKKLPGSPDIAFPGRKKAIFVHGCFWHGHHCKLRVPRTNKEYWQRKLERNRKRDAWALAELRRAGWRAKVVWECEIGKTSLPYSLRRFVGPI